MIAAADTILPLADNNTKIVPGHGPLGNKADLAKFREMLVTSRDRIQKLKSAGKSAQEAVASKPSRTSTRLGATDCSIVTPSSRWCTWRSDSSAKKRPLGSLGQARIVPEGS
jgi:hypothetical protein